MNDPESSDSAVDIKRLAELAAYPIGAAGVVLVALAGGWWFYATVQNGITYTQVGETGGVLLFVSLSLYLLSRDHESSDASDKFLGDRDD